MGVTENRYLDLASPGTDTFGHQETRGRLLADLLLANHTLNGGEMPQSNEAFTVLASAARTADTASADFYNIAAGGVTFFLDVTEAEAETLTIYLQGKDPISGNYVNLANSGALSISATGTQVWQPAVPLPRIWRINADKSASGSATYSIGASYTRTHL